MFSIVRPLQEAKSKDEKIVTAKAVAISFLLILIVSVHFYKFHFENKVGIGRDAARSALCAVS